MAVGAVSPHRYGPHDPSTAPSHCRTQDGPGLELHPDLIRQRRRLNEIAHTGNAPTLAPVPLGAITPEEWATFTAALRAAAVDGLVHQSAVRPLIRGRIQPKHIGQCYRRARTLGLIVADEPERSDDYAGRNAGRWEPKYRLGAAA